MFHENLKRLREAKGLTQAALAEALGAPLRTVQGWEQGRREPALEMVGRIARTLGVSADALLEEKAPAAPKKARKRKGK
jgi:transcriptional regulator with XRE-family HTH domain